MSYFSGICLVSFEVAVTVFYSLAGIRRSRVATAKAAIINTAIMAATPFQPDRIQKIPPSVPEILEPR
jgi:hypothetical protein